MGIKSYKEQGISAGEYVVHCLEIITCAVPPALPTCLAVGTAMAASRYANDYFQQHKTM